MIGPPHNDARRRVSVARVAGPRGAGGYRWKTGRERTV
jgi:hypothetical protein